MWRERGGPGGPFGKASKGGGVGSRSLLSPGRVCLRCGVWGVLHRSSVSRRAAGPAMAPNARAGVAGWAVSVGEGGRVGRLPLPASRAQLTRPRPPAQSRRRMAALAGPLAHHMFTSSPPPSSAGHEGPAAVPSACPLPRRARLTKRPGSTGQDVRCEKRGWRVKILTETKPGARRGRAALPPVLSRRAARARACPHQQCLGRQDGRLRPRQGGE